MVLIISIILIIAALVIITFLLYKKGLFSRAKSAQALHNAQKPAQNSEGDDSVEASFKRNLRGLGIFSGGILALLLSRLWSMQLISTEEYAQKAEINRTRTIKTSAPRGRILDRNGVALVDNRTSLTVTAMPEVLSNSIEMQLVANLVGMPYMAVKRKIQDQSLGAQSARVVAIDVDKRIVAYLGEHADFFHGIDVDERTQRNYPFKDLAAHVLGYTGPVTKEQLEKTKTSQENSVSYSVGDIIGQAGVELQYESVLQGISGEQRVFVDADGHITAYSDKVPAQAGSDIVLTIDKDIQQAAEDGLQHAISRAHKQGNTQCNSACCVVLDAKDGSVLACASAPTYDPGIFVGGISKDTWEQLSDKKSGYPLMNKVVSGQFVAASTIKPLSAFAALDYGFATANTDYYCTGYWTGMGKRYGKYCWNHKGHGHINLERGITFSCDVVFYEIAKAAFNSDHKEALQDTFRKWGLGKLTHIDLPGETSGLIPDAKWKWNHFTSANDADRQWQGGDTANIAIGQGDIQVTCIQMASVYMGIANKGTIWKPHVLHAIKSHSSEGSVIDFKPQVNLEPKESESNYKLVDGGLLGVIYDESPSISEHFKNLPVKVAGKTGTGERKNDKASTGWFCCFAPYDKPEYVIAAVVENGGFGSSTAMFTCRDILGEIYNAKDTVSDDLASDLQ